MKKVSEKNGKTPEKTKIRTYIHHQYELLDMK